MEEVNEKNPAAKSPIRGESATVPCTHRPCPVCGCPYRGDHTQDCLAGDLQAYFEDLWGLTHADQHDPSPEELHAGVDYKL